MPAIEDRLEELFMNDANNRRVAAVNVPPRPSPWRGVLAFTGAAVILGIIALAAIVTFRGEPQAAAPKVSASPIATSTPLATSTPPTPSGESATSVATGTVTGTLGYPSEGIPALAVYALPTNNLADGRYVVFTERSDRTVTYGMQLPPGTYYLVAYGSTAPAGNRNGGAYTKYVTCGLQPPCSDHSLIPVTITAGQTVNGIDIRDWYAGVDAYPSRPAN